MNNYKGIFSTILVVVLLSGIKSFADTFVVTNLNDPGAGSLRQAITNSNLNPGPDEIVFEEGLEGTIALNVGAMSIQDNLTIRGPGAEIITIDADHQSPIFEINDFDDEVNSIVKISGLRLINGDGGINNYSENVEVENCQFINNNAAVTGGAILNRKILTVDSCLFDNNSATFGGGAISNDDQEANLIVRNSIFLNNHDSIGGGAIANVGIIELITNCTFVNNNVFSMDSSGGAIQNSSGTINEISHCTFENNSASGGGGAINNFEGFIKSIVNSTFSGNIAKSGSAIWNNGAINISFLTLAYNKPLPSPTPPPPPMGVEPLGVIVTAGNGVTRIRNSIIGLNNIDSCAGPVIDLVGNWSSDTSCGFLGDNVQIILGPLADNGGPTETIALLGGDPVDGATVNCDALNDMGNPIGIPVGVDQRYFPRPSGVRCDSGAFESQATATVTITKVSDPSGVEHFRFGSNGFDPLQDCPLDGGGDGIFILNDGDSLSCIVPQGNYSIQENIPQGYRLSILCFEAPDNIVINNQTGKIEFTIDDSGSDVDCLYTNVRKEGGGGGGCTLAPAGAGTPIPLYLLIPVLIVIRRIMKKQRDQ